MNIVKRKLELTWVGKEEHPRLEPRILVEDQALSYHAKERVTEADMFENKLIFGDNLLALKALEQEYAGKVKCIYIDPPYNTGSAFAQYEDGLEHSIWLTMMRDRLEHLERLLAPEGSCWVQLDDNEAHYCKVLMDEIFGRQNFVANVIWNKSYAVRSNAQFFSTAHEHILVYCKDREKFRPNKFTRGEKQESRYDNPDGDPRGPWQSVTMTISLVGGARGRQYAKTGKSDNLFEVVSPSGKTFTPPPNRCWSRNPSGFAALDAEKRIWWGPRGDRAPRLKMFRSEAEEGILPTTLWAEGETFGLNQQGIREIRALELPDFPTPKPEQLMAKVLEIGSEPGDLILDSFGGSGTTAAVAHKMCRRWIVVELREHCHTHIVPRLRRLIDGEDPGGITEAVGWKGGGGFKFYRLAETLLVRDKDLSTQRKAVYVINPKYDAAMLIRAICKIENYRFRQNHHWHGISSEHHFLYVTTKLLDQKQLNAFSNELSEDAALLIYCTRKTSGLKVPDNIEIKKIPRDLLAKCTFEEGRV